MSSLKQRKIRKLRGRKTGYGAKKKHRGSGSRGGKGKAGLHKYKWSWTVTREPDHFKKPSMKPKPRLLNIISLGQINDIAVKKGLKEIELKGFKVLSDGNLTKAIKIKADAFSKSAVEKIKSAGANFEELGTKKEKISPPPSQKKENPKK